MPVNRLTAPALGTALKRSGFRAAIILDSQGFILTVTAEEEAAGLMGAWKRYAWLKTCKAQLDVEFGKRLLWVDQLLTVQLHRQWPEHAPSKGIQSSAEEALLLLTRLEKSIVALSPLAVARPQPQEVNRVPLQENAPIGPPSPPQDPPF